MKKMIKYVLSLILTVCVLFPFAAVSISAEANLIPKDVSGDINDDGEINAADAVILAQFLAGWNVEVNKYSCDVNGDSLINAADAVHLAQFLAGWDVVLTGPVIGDNEIDSGNVFK